MQQKRLAPLTPKYSYGAYNSIKPDTDEQWIRITEGCPNQCPYCYEPKEYKIFGVPEITRNEVKIMDMNLLAKPEAIHILAQLAGKRVNGKVVHYELVCGIDYRFLTPNLVGMLKSARFDKIRIAWDWSFKEQKRIKAAIEMLLKVGYKPNNIMIFMICNWKIPYSENLQKLDLCKVWGVQVSDCYFDNQTFPNVVPIHWKSEELKDFRHKCRKHNQIVNFKIDPEVD